MIAVYNQEKSPRSTKGVRSMKLGWGSGRNCFFAAPATLFGGLGDPLPGGRGQQIRFGRLVTRNGNAQAEFNYEQRDLEGTALKVKHLGDTAC